MFKYVNIKKVYSNVLGVMFCFLYSYLYGLEIDYIVTTPGKVNKIDFKTLLFSQKNQKLRLLVDTNTAKEFSLEDICYIRFKNNKGIVFNPIPRVELNSGEVLVSPFSGVSKKEEKVYVMFDSPEWFTSQSGKSIKADLINLRRIMLQQVDATVDSASDYIIFRGGDFDRGFIDTITDEEIFIKSEIFGDKKKPVLKRYKIKGNKDQKDDVVQIHFTELGNVELDKNLVYVVVIVGDGSKIIGRLKNIQQGRFMVESVGFGDMEILDSYVHSIYTLNSRCIYLSDLPIIYSKTYSRVLKRFGIEDNTLPFKVMKDCSSKECKPIALAKEQFPKGLGIHTTTVMKIKLGRTFKKLFSFYGIDENVLQNYSGMGAKASFKIYGDGKLLLAKNNIVFSQKLRSFLINVEKVDVLKIIVAEPRFPWHKDAFILGRFSLALPILTK